MQIRYELLRQSLIHPKELIALQPAEWDWLIPQARSAGVLARMQFLVVEQELASRIPKIVRPHLESAGVVASNEERLMRFELDRIERALAGVETSLILLKGAAYI